METINVNQNTYVSQGPTKAQFNKQQISLLNKSMLIAGIGFILICAFSELFAWAFSNTQIYNQFATVLGLTFGFLIISMIIGILWTKILWKGKAIGLTILVCSLYVITMSLAFGTIFGFLNWGQEDNSKYGYLCICFAIAGGIFLLVALISKIMSMKSIVTYGKIVAITSIIMSFLLLSFMISMLVVGCSGQAGSGFIITTDVITWMILIGMSIVTFFYIIIDVKSIMGLSQFNELTGNNKIPSSIIWYCGFRLLSDLINVVFLVIIFLIKIRGRVR